MLKQLLAAVALVASSAALAASGHTVHLDKAPIDLTDKESLQRGARMFQNYCLGCHQMEYQRYSRTFRDLGIPDEVGMEQLAFTAKKVGDHIKNAAPKTDLAKWFGAAPPDLTNVARVRGPDWLYTYLRSFYADPSRPFGVNNDVFPMVGMPHVLQELQGLPYKAYETRLVDGESKQVYVGIKTDGTGELSTEEEVYMECPPGMENSEGKVLFLQKTIYGLVQAARAFYKKLSQVLRSIGFPPNF